ncbi:MAG: ABC transporter ATP-binding protein [Alphaproteobacteria bacterium]|nr:ABC transporter ATP-binding protein [Alphaproteobacteria bacterium]NCQ66805.1 ABC transporter ATP-binding protein [Alphaproteobacteria bacterium]NCT07373.1 ABC transporter ATP-binding protein [Alphaproteobacteria bacterium]
MSKTPVILNIRNLTKTFTQGSETLDVLRGINLSLHAGEIVALVGSSGSGKSTLLHIAGLLDKPTDGEIILNNLDVLTLSEKKRAQQRRDNIGFVYQFHHLLPEFNALENVMMPLIIQGHPLKEATQKAEKLLKTVNLLQRASHRPSRLSGGEQQRVAILRALIGSPKILLADEPTGNLDADTSALVFKELVSLVRTHKIGALIATHDLSLAEQMDRIVYLDHGLLR